MKAGLARVDRISKEDNNEPRCRTQMTDGMKDSDVNVYKKGVLDVRVDRRVVTSTRR